MLRLRAPNPILYRQLVSIERILKEGGQLLVHRYIRDGEPPVEDLQQLLKERKNLHEELGKIGIRFENLI